MNTNDFIKRASSFKTYFDVLGIREEAKRELGIFENED